MLLRVAICARQRGNNLSHLNAVYDAHFIFAAFAVFRRPLRGHISAVGHTKLVHETFQKNINCLLYVAMIFTFVSHFLIEPFNGNEKTNQQNNERTKQQIVEPSK